MSTELVSWALEVPIKTAAAKVVLIAICDKIHKGSPYFYGSQEYLAKRACVSDRQVRAHLSWLEKQGHIRREKRTSGEGKRLTDHIFVRPEFGVKATGNPSYEPAEVERTSTGSLASEPPEIERINHRKPTSDKTAVDTEDNTSKSFELFPKEEGQDISKLFDEWWEHVPTGRKKDRKACRQIFTRVLKKREATFEELLAGMKSYTTANQGTELQFIKHPKTWLNGECWNDEVAPPGSTAGVGENFAAREVYVDAQTWENRLRNYQNNAKLWNPDWGRKPGEPGCQVPEEICNKFTPIQEVA